MKNLLITLSVVLFGSLALAAPKNLSLEGQVQLAKGGTQALAVSLVQVKECDHKVSYKGTAEFRKPETLGGPTLSLPALATLKNTKQGWRLVLKAQGAQQRTLQLAFEKVSPELAVKTQLAGQARVTRKVRAGNPKNGGGWKTVVVDRGTSTLTVTR